MTEELVVDASVIMKWLVPEPDSPLALDWYRNRQYDLIAPFIAHAEIANGLWKQARQGKLPLDKAHIALNDFYGKVMLSFYPDDNYMQRAFSIASMANHDSVYDCVYLALAEQRSAQLLTADRKFINKLANTPLSRYLVALPSHASY